MKQPAIMTRTAITMMALANDNFSPLATDDFGCQFLGCTYLDAENYDAGANDDDGSCAFSLMNPCPTDLNGDGITAAGDILEMLAFYGQPCQ